LGPAAPRRVMRGTATYAAAAVLQRSLGFLLLPVYARVLTPFDYGQLAIVLTVTGALGTILGLGLETAVFRAWIQLATKPAERLRFVNTVAGFGLLFPSIAALLLAGPLAVATQAAFAIPPTVTVVSVVGAGVAASLTSVPLALLRAEERLADYVRVSALQLVLGTGLPLLFVVVLRWGVFGWVLAGLVASFIVLVAGVFTLSHDWSRDIHRASLMSALAFGLPMIPHALSHWALALSDRAILGTFLPTADVGVYQLAYQFGIPIMVISGAMAQSAQPLYVEATRDEERRGDIRRITTKQATTVGLLAMAVGLLAPPLITVLLPPAYGVGATYIPWIAVGAGLYGLYLIPMNAVTLIAGRNRWVWVVTMAAAGTNVALNIALVPVAGALAAAIDTTIGYGVLLAGVYAYMLRVCSPPPQFEIKRIGTGMLLIGAAWGLGAAIPGGSWIADLGIRGLAVLAVAGLLSASGRWFAIPWPRADRRAGD
jgi:O-antigen/teichoic acid export membrane protein